MEQACFFVAVDVFFAVGEEASEGFSFGFAFSGCCKAVDGVEDFQVAVAVGLFLGVDEGEDEVEEPPVGAGTVFVCVFIGVKEEGDVGGF